MTQDFDLNNNVTCHRTQLVGLIHGVSWLRPQLGIWTADYCAYLLTEVWTVASQFPHGPHALKHFEINTANSSMQTMTDTASVITMCINGAVSLQSEQTFNRAWNPSLRLTQWLKITIYAAATVIRPDRVGYYGSHEVNLKLAFRFHALLIMTILPL